jgi:crotonobetainyl-CoA:carnitine CoA-transferase CaiB-like acyl-CoA transferase
MLRALGAMHLAEDPRFETGKTRMIHLDALITTLAPLFRPLTTADVLARMQAEGVPAGPVLSVQQMLAHPQTHARGMVPTVQHPVAGAVQTIGLPIKFSATPGGVQDAAPLLGQHTREVLSELGYATADIARMLDTGAAKAV